MCEREEPAVVGLPTQPPSALRYWSGLPTRASGSLHYRKHTSIKIWSLHFYQHEGAGFVAGGLRRGKVDLTVISLYLRDSEGLSGPVNSKILGELITFVRNTPEPWILGGGWNVEPDEVANTTHLSHEGLSPSHGRGHLQLGSGIGHDCGQQRFSLSGYAACRLGGAVEAARSHHSEPQWFQQRMGVLATAGLCQSAGC